jgi:hypothetical protein
MAVACLAAACCVRARLSRDCELLSAKRLCASVGDADLAGWISPNIAVLTRPAIGGLRCFSLDTRTGARRGLAAVDAALAGRGLCDIGFDVADGGGFVAAASGYPGVVGNCNGRAVRGLRTRWNRLLAFRSGWIGVRWSAAGGHRISWNLHPEGPGAADEPGSFDAGILPPDESLRRQRCAATDDGWIIDSTWDPEAPIQSGMEVLVIRTDRPGLARRLQVAFPNGVSANEIGEVAYSKDGRRVAILSIQGEPDWLRRYLAGFRSGDAAMSRVWVADLGAGNWTCLGSAHLDGLAGGIENLRWLPGGRALSYQFDHTVYIARVPASRG